MTNRNLLPFLALAALLTTMPASAGMSFGVGPKLGVNFANANVANHDKTDTRIGAAVGGIAEFGVTSPYSLVLEPLYIQRGADVDYTFGGFSATVKGEVDYLEIPVLLKAKFGKIRSHAYVFAGPSMGILLKAEGRFQNGTQDLKDQAATLTWSGDIGAGATYQVSRFVYASADARYTLGFSNALDETVGGDIDEWKARDIRIMVGLLFHLTE